MSPLVALWRRTRRSLQGRLFVSLTILFITLSALQSWQHFSQARTLQELREQSEEHRAVLMAERFSASVEHVLSNQRLLAQAAFGGSLDPSAATAFLTDAVSQFDGLASLQVHGRDGSLLFTYPQSAPTTDSRILGRLTERDPVLLSDVYVGADGQGDRFRVITLAMTRDGSPAGAIATEFFTRVLSDWLPRAGPNDVQILIDSGGRIVYSSSGIPNEPVQKALAGLASPSREEGPRSVELDVGSGERRHLRVARTRHGQWTAGFLESYSAAFEWWRWESGLAYIVLVAVLLLLGGGLLLAVRFSLRPVTRLAAASRKLATGDLELRLEQPEVSEFDGLVDAFNRMAANLQAARTQLQNSNSYLEERIAERTRELAEEHSKLLRAERLSTLGLLSGGIAHDLRNPLNTVALGIHSLKNRLKESGDERVHRRLDSVERELRRATRIIDTLLNFARSGQPERRTLTAEELLDSLAEAGPELDGARLTVEPVAPDLTLYLDPDQILQVLENLIRNGAQAAGPEGEVSLRVGEGEDGWFFEVRDTGPGIPDEIRHSLFEPLVSRKSSGTGIGLALAHRIVASHDGRIEVESEEGVGALFRVVLPRFEAAPTSEGEGDMEGAGNPSPR